MKITLEIDNEVLAQTFRQAHCGYWCASIDFNPKTMRGTVIDSYGNKLVKFNGVTIETGLLNLAKYNPRIFAKLLENDLDGPMADVVLQFCAGLTWTDSSGKTSAKYG